MLSHMLCFVFLIFASLYKIKDSPIVILYVSVSFLMREHSRQIKWIRSLALFAL